MRKFYVFLQRKAFFLLFCIFGLLSVTAVKAQADIPIGTGTTGNSNTTYPCPVQDYFEGSRAQYLYRASELLGAGMGPGFITEIKFNVISLATSGNTPPHFPLDQHTIKIGTTAATTLGTTTWETVSTTVYGPVNYTVIQGINTFTFSAPFVWNGTDNIVIEICNGDAANTAGDARWTGNSVVPWTTGLAFNGSHTNIADNAGSLCGTTATGNSGTQTTRPNIIFSWTPATTCSGIPVAGNAATDKLVVCFNESFTLNLNGNTISSGLTYQWQSSPDFINWSSVSGATTLNYTTTQPVSSYYRCIVTCTNGGDKDTSTVVQVLSTPPVSGTYTINNTLPTGAGNFQSFADAVNFISCGINGAVVFNVAPGSGPYLEQVTIPNIGGTSAANTITFNCNGAILQYASANSNLRAGILLNGADYVIVDSLTIEASGGTYAWGIVLTNTANNNIFRKCTINIGNFGSASTNYMGIALNGSATGTAVSGNNANNNLFDRNIINGGYYGFYAYGNSATSSNNTNNVFSNNTVTDSYSYSIFYTYQSGGVISKNDVYRPNRTNSGTSAGVYLSTSCANTLIEKNRIHNMFDMMSTNTSTFYGIYVGGTGASGQENRVVNNLIYNPGGNTSAYGIYNSGSPYMLAYHNTISLDDLNATSGLAYGIYQTTSATGISIRNNIVSVTRSGTGNKRCLYFATTGFSLTSNNNVLYITPDVNNFVGQYGTTNYATLNNWKTANANAYDQQSVSINPLFVNATGGNYAPTAPTINDIGANLSIATDITGATRPATPDPGAYEFSLPPCANPAAGGTAISSAATICAGNVFTLDLTGNSYGVGQTYQWQSSPDNGSTPWINVGAAGNSPLINTSQTATQYYRAAVTCSGGTTVYSTSIQVISPVLVNGAFTINSAVPTGSGNFQSFNEAVNSMLCGINGAVTFNVVPGSGPYNEQVIIPAIPGASAINTITFNGNGATLQYNSANTNIRAGIFFDGADYIRVDSLIIDGSAGTYAWGILMMNQADNNIIRKSTINIGNLTSTSTNYIGIMLNGSATSTATSGNNANNNLFDRNRINGGYYGIYAYGSSSANNTNNIFTNNIVLDNYAYGIFLTYQAGSTVGGNDIARPARTTSTTAAGVYVSTSCVNTLVEKNRIHNMFDAMPTSTSTMYGIYVGGTGTTALPNKLFNNLIYNPGGNGSVYGIYNSSSPYMQAYHNTISLDDAAATSALAYGIYQTGTATGINIRNNVVSISRTGTGTKRCLYFATTGSTIVSNNNLLFMGTVSGTNNHIGQYGTTNFTTLANWQTANTNAYDQLSISTDPIFYNSAGGNYSPVTTLIDNKGAAVAVATDITGLARNPTTPDPGAYEVTVFPGINMSAVSLVTPAVAASGCYTSAETVTIKVRNNSSSPIDFAVNPVTVTVNVTGGATQTLTGTINTGTLATNATIDVVMSTPLDMTAVGAYSFNGYTSVSGDANLANDSMLPATRTKVAINPGTIAANPSAYCVTPGTPTLTTTGGAGYSSLQWQSSPTSGTGFTDITGATTSPYTVTSPITQVTYYKLVASCGTSSATTGEDTVIINNPLVTGTTAASRCGPGTLTLNATGSAGATLNWYANATGGASLATGTTFTTPSLNTTTTYYVSANAGGGGSGQLTLMPFAGPNGCGGGIMFNVTPVAALNVTGFTANLGASAGTSVAVGIWYKTGTYLGFETTQAAWTLHQTVTVTAAGPNNPTTILINPLPLGAVVNAVYLNADMDYTNISSATNYSNADLSVQLGSGLCSLFGGNNPLRGFNGTIMYSAGCASPRTAVVATVVDSTTVTTEPSDIMVCPAGDATFTVVAAGGALAYQWRKNGTNITGATSSSYTITGVSATDLADYDVIVVGDCGTDTSATATLAFNPVTDVAVQPLPQTVCEGTSATFTVTATGTGTLTYQWKKDGVDIAGATSATLTIAPVAMSDAGEYKVMITGECGTDSSDAVILTVNPLTAITVHPLDQAICANTSATFTVTATGAGTLTYQWRKGGVNITGATSATYTINPVTIASADDYDVIVTGGCSSDTSDTGTLQVIPATAITTQPAAAAQLLCVGSDITLTVIAGGDALTYQWRKGGTNITGATSSSYTITGLTLADGGNYDVVVTGTCSSVTSNIVSVSVNPAGTWTGANSSDWNTTGNWCGGIPTAITDVIIPSTAPNMPNLSAAGSVRSIALNTGSSLIISAGGVLNLYGSITGNGAFTATSGSIVFLGTTSQSIPAFTATNVTMNGNGGVVPGGNSSITGTLTLTNGHITLGSNNLTLAAGSTGSLASHIITEGTGHVVITGLAASATRVIPVGTNAGSYNPVTLQANAGHTTDNFTVRVVPGVYLNGASGAQFTEYVVDRTWLINEAIAGGSNVNVTLQWTGIEELPKFERTRSYVMQHNGTEWIPGAETAAAGTNPYTQTKTGVTTFSPFGVQKLPIPDAPTGIYPNPVVRILNIVVRPVVPEQMTLSVYDMSGKLLIVQRESVPGYPSILELDVTKLVAGMYILKVSTTRDKEFMVRKFLKAN